MKIIELLSEAYGRRYTSYHDELTSLDRDMERQWDQEKRDFKRHELQHELGHERNNIQVVINGKPWKVFAGRGAADSNEEFKHLQHMKNWAAKKSASTGKKWEVYLTGADPTLEETATAGSTSAGNVAVGAVYKNKPPKQPKNKDGTAKNALDMKANLLTGGSIKR